MTISKIEELSPKGKRTKGKIVFHILCNQCEIIFFRDKNDRDLNRELHFCSKKCSIAAQQNGGILFNQVKNTVKEKYGVENVFNLKEFQDKAKETMIEKYGVEHPMQLESFKEKIKNTTFKKYGVEFVSQNEEIKKRIKETNLEKYGVENPAQNSEIIEKIKKTNLERYGAECAMQSKEIKESIEKNNLIKFGHICSFGNKEVREKRKATMIERYGVENPVDNIELKNKAKEAVLKKYGVENVFHLPEMQDKIKKINLEKYGVEYPFQSSDFVATFDYSKQAERCHETKKKNGSYGKSKAEDACYEFLVNHFGAESVERQPKVNGWAIDFLIKNTNVFIQFDGVYFHGLDRPIELIKNSSAERDQSIYQLYLKDRHQEQWFSDNGLTLIRISDVDFQNSNGALLIEKINRAVEKTSNADILTM